MDTLGRDGHPREVMDTPGSDGHPGKGWTPMEGMEGMDTPGREGLVLRSISALLQAPGSLEKSLQERQIPLQGQTSGKQNCLVGVMAKAHTQPELYSVTVTAEGPGAGEGGISDKLAPFSSGIWERRVLSAVQSREMKQSSA